MKHIVVLTGAGMSAESGIKTFRDADGLWEGHDVMEVASPQGFAANPELVLDFYNQRRRQLFEVQPNTAHTALANLEKNYPDFRSLMREYEEGILLFEATKINVWDKASKDTSGLEEFFKMHKDDYIWGDRAEILDITLATPNPEEARKMKDYIMKKGIDKAVKKFNKKAPVIKFTRKLSEEKAKKDYQPLEFKADIATELKSGKENEFVFRYVPKMHKPTNKTMDEARGYIIADYQDELEKRWIKSLEDEYPVELDKEVFESLIQE